MPSVYNRLGPYDIRREIGRGGMAVVFLATDTRNSREVALRSVPHYSGQDVLEAEQRGAELQKQFCQVSAFVPEVYDHGSEEGYFYVAMEYLEGENLSQVIRRGPMPADRAVKIAIELCRFLEDARNFAWKEGGRDFRHLLHGDLTPGNIRIMSGDRVKVLDFGIAKALSMSRKVTRNDFGNLAYLSPERIESGGEMDATDGFWALGVMLYEMLRGAPPFSAPDTRRLERAIIARRPVPLPSGLCSVGLQAIVARLLGPTPADRYPSATAIREDLERLQQGVDTEAQTLGWPHRIADEPATRRMEQPETSRLEPPTTRLPEPTRRTVPPPLPVIPPAAPSPAPASRLASAVAGIAGGAGAAAAASRVAGAAGSALPRPLKLPPSPAGAPRKPARRGPLSLLLDPLLQASRPARLVLAVLLVAFIGNEIIVGRAAGRVANRVPAQDLSALRDRWADYENLAARSIGPATWRLESVLKRRTAALTDRLIASYREGLSVVWSAQWTEARETLIRAVAADPGSNSLNAALRYCDGHLHRINGDEYKRTKKADAARREYAAAITAFREAAELRNGWPDPFIGLARTFVLGLGDVDRGSDALEQARRLGYVPNERDSAQLAEGFVDRGDTLWRTARDLRGMPQERESLARAEAAYQRSLELTAAIATYGGVPASMRRAQAGIERVQARVHEIEWSGLQHDPGTVESAPESGPVAEADAPQEPDTNTQIAPAF